jgi:serine/threonine protein kinase
MAFDDSETREKAYDRLIGTTLGDRYDIIEAVSSGGAGDVYKVRHREMGRMYAAKVMRSSGASPDSLKRFQREAQILCRLRHPNIVTVHSFGLDDKVGPYLIMDLLEGVNLQSLVRAQGPLPLERASKLLIGICDGMSSAHKIGIVHRDIKPSNVMIVGEGREQRAVIIDFGAGKLLENTEQQRLTQTDAIVGTPFYMAPEQCLSKPIDKRTDVYAMGCLMYEVLTGKPPFVGESSFDVMQKHLNEVPAPPSVANPTGRIPAQIDQLVNMALQKDPQARMDTFTKIKEALEIALQRPTYAKVFLGSATYLKLTQTKFPQRKMIVAISLIAALLVCGGLFWFSKQQQHEPEAKSAMAPEELHRKTEDRDRLMLARKFDEARPVALEVLKENRTYLSNPIVLFQSLQSLGEIDFYSGRFSDAVKDFQALDPYMPNKPDVIGGTKLLHVRALTMLGRMAEAEQELDKIPMVETLPRDIYFQVPLERAKLRVSAGDFLTAEKCAREAVATAPTKELVDGCLVRLASVLRKEHSERKTKEALQIMLKLYAEKPSDVVFNAELAMCHLAVGDLAAARKEKNLVIDYFRTQPADGPFDERVRKEITDELAWVK